MLPALALAHPAAAGSLSIPSAPASITVSAVAHACAPLGVQARRWEWFPLAGLEVTLPTGLPGLGAGLAAQIGHIEGALPAEPELVVLEFGLTVSYQVRIARSRFMLVPAIGLVSTAVFTKGAQQAGEAVFSWSESEFGPLAGLETAVRIGRWHVGVPARFVCVLSAPDPFPHVDIGVKVSRAF